MAQSRLLGAFVQGRSGRNTGREHERLCPAGRELGTGERGLPGKLGVANFEVGVIAGNRSLNPFYSLLIPGKDDGKVSIDHARLEGMADYLVVPHSHTFIMNSDHVIEQVRHFLAEGRFEARQNRSEIL